MLNKAVRLYGKNDLRLDEFELPEIKDDEFLQKSYPTVFVCLLIKRQCRARITNVFPTILPRNL